MRVSLAFMCNNEKSQDTFIGGVEVSPLTVARLESFGDSLKKMWHSHRRRFIFQRGRHLALGRIP